MTKKISDSEKISLKEIQKYVAKATKERGFDSETIPEKLMLTVEEFGELAKAIRRTKKIKIDSKSNKYHVRHEVADVFFYLLDICNKCNIDLEEAFFKKEKINKKRNWS